MNIDILACGRLKEKYWRAAEDDYTKRIARYCKLTIRELNNDAALLAALPKRAHVYALDERGDAISSRDLANILDSEEQHGGGAPVIFTIGGPDGHSDAMRTRATRLLAFGRITIAHRLVRILLMEQLYRGFRIVRGHPYHRD